MRTVCGETFDNSGPFKKPNWVPTFGIYEKDYCLFTATKLHDCHHLANMNMIFSILILPPYKIRIHYCQSFLPNQKWQSTIEEGWDEETQKHLLRLSIYYLLWPCAADVPHSCCKNKLGVAIFVDSDVLILIVIRDKSLPMPKM